MTGNIFAKGIAGSAQNAAFGRDRDYRILKTPNPRKVMIVGGGSGGMEYALAARAAGHSVILYEKSGELGGAMNWAGGYRTLPNMEQIAYQPQYHRRMIEKESIAVRLGVEVTAELVLAEQPDVVVIATGARPALPEVDGLAEALGCGFALTIDDVLKGKALPDGPIAIWGAGEGIELALDLAQQGRVVRLLDPNEKLMPAAYIGSRSGAVMRWAAKVGLASEHEFELAMVSPGAVEVRKDGKAETVACAALVLAPGRLPYNPLSRGLLGTGVIVQVIGDARMVRGYGNAIHEAAYLARRL
jgi:2,4-dienoyl-CoA reductase (NADPH2)